MRIQYKLFFCLLLMAASAAFLPGCWNYKEIDKLSLVSGVGVDEDEQGRYLLTIEIVDMHEGGKEAKMRSKLIETSGDTIFDAVRNSLEITAFRLYWGHVETCIISRKVAEEDIIPVIDWLTRDSEPRLNINLYVSFEKTAKEILEAQSITGEIRSYEINNMLQVQNILSKTYIVEVYDFVNSFSNEGISAVLPAIQLVEREQGKTSEISGIAVFKEDKLIGYLNGDEAKYFNFIRNKIKGGVIPLNDQPDPGDEAKDDVALEIFGNKTILEPEYAGGKISFTLKVNTKVAIDEFGAAGAVMDDKKISEVEKKAEELLTANIQQLIKKVQKEFDADIFGFGNKIYKDMPWLWEKIGGRWNNIFKEIDVKVDVKVHIQDTGLLSKAIDIGD